MAQHTSSFENLIVVVIDDNYTGCTYFGGDIPPFQITTEKNLANVGCRVKIEKTVGVVSQTAERPFGPDSYVNLHA